MVNLEYLGLTKELSSMFAETQELSIMLAEMKRKIQDLENDILILKMANEMDLYEKFSSNETLWLLALRQSMKNLLESRKTLDIDMKTKKSAYSILCSKLTHPNIDQVISILPNIPPVFNAGLKRSQFGITANNGEDILLSRKEIDNIINDYLKTFQKTR